MIETCVTPGEEDTYKNLVEKSRQEYISKMELKQVVTLWIGVIWLRTGTIGGFL
jgi:hypothetical protein